jgi:hypothetical protein
MILVNSNSLVQINYTKKKFQNSKAATRSFQVRGHKHKTIKHYKITCRFQFNNGTGTTESPVEFKATRDRQRLIGHVAQWLRYCATNQKVAGSTPDGVTEFFIDINPSDRTMDLGSTQSLTEMNTRRISWG